MPHYAPHRRPLPAFCIVGAPKSGTTSMAKYLGTHPGVFFSEPKEPRFFCWDNPGYRLVHTLQDYIDLFRDALPGQLCGEGSAAYLFSPVAVPELLHFNPAVRLIVMVRNPLDMLPSLHQQKQYSFEEHVRDFETAWRLSAARAKGLAVRRPCKAPTYLNYVEQGKLGKQLSRLLGLVPRDQVHVIVFDDLVADPLREYHRTLDFLGLPYDGRTDFPVLNARQEHVAPGLMSLLTLRPIRRLRRMLKLAFPAITTPLSDRFYAAMTRPAARTPLPPELRREMAQVFERDVARLGRLLGRDLSPWLA